MPRHIEVQNTPPVMSNDEEAIENAKGDRRYGEEIHRGNCFTMIAQKCHPSLSWLGTPRHSPHPTQHGTFRSVEAQHLQLTVNARRAPSGILRDHAKDQLAQFPAHTLSSHGGPMPREPPPIQLETRSVPANNSLRLDEDQRPIPSRPKPSQDHPEEFVRNTKPRLRTPSLQNSKLLPQCQVFQEQIAA
jgi:hypothetical protein